VISLEKCRKILGDSSLSDNELEAIREAMYGLAFVAFDEFAVKPKDTSRESSPDEGVERLQFTKALALTPEIESEQIEERAAIKQFEAGLSKDEAERSAIQEYIDRQRL